MSDENPEIIIPAGESDSAGVPAPLKQVLPEQILIVPMRQRPFFPAQTMPIVLDEKIWSETIERVVNTPHKMVGLVYAPHWHEDTAPSADQLSDVGTIARVHQPHGEAGRVQFIAEGLERFRIERFVREQLTALDHIGEVHSHIAVTEIKNSTQLPLFSQL